MVTRWTFFKINAITPLNFLNRNSSTNLITIFCEMVPSLRASWKIKIIKTKKIVAYFKVYSWGVYNQKEPPPSPSSPSADPTHTLYNICTHPDSDPGSLWRHLLRWRSMNVNVLDTSRTFYAGNLHLSRSGVCQDWGFVKKVCQTSASVGSLVCRRRPLISVGGSPLSDECSRVTFPCCLIEKLSLCVLF